jgi:hypothetical protein
MKRQVGFWLVLLTVLACGTGTGVAAGAAPAEGGPLPQIVLPAPKDPEQVAYLGIGKKKEFTVADLPAEVVIIQIFNMY